MAITRPRARRASSLALPLLLFAASAGALEQWVPKATLLASDAESGDGLGNGVDLSGASAVLGATAEDGAGGMSRGAAYVFVRSGASWAEQQRLTASDATLEDHFGASSAVSGDVALIGANFEDGEGAEDRGAVYVFVRSGTTWSQQQKLLSSMPDAFAQFGFSVALEGGTALVGAPRDDTEASSAGGGYVFEFPPAVPALPAAWLGAPGILLALAGLRVPAAAGRRR